MKRYRYTVVLERAEEGGYIAVCPALQGCYTQGETKKEALEMIRDAIHLHIESRLDRGEPVPEESGAQQVTVSV